MLRPVSWRSSRRFVSGEGETALHQPREDLPLIYLQSPVNVVGMSANLTGFRPVPDGMIRLQGPRVSK
jgi:hypothetical protein